MICREINEVATASFLKEHDNFVLLCHASPDGDTLGSAHGLLAALRQLGKKAKLLCPDEIPQKFDIIKCDRDGDFEPQTVVAVDVADQKLLGCLQQEFEGKVDLCIDHHSTNTRYADLLYCESDSAAACECVYKVVKTLGVEITPYIASCLYLGMSTDTGCFKFSNTTPRTLRFAAELMEKEAAFVEINRVMFETKSKERIAMERLVLENMEFYFDGRCAVLTVTEDMINSTGCDRADLDGITAISRQIEGVVIGITIKEQTDGSFKVSLRTHEPYNAAEICANFGGGGHVRAAGCRFDCSSAEAKNLLLSKISEVLTNGK